MTQHNTALYAKRRAQLAAQLGDGGVAILPTAPERGRNRDSDFLYRHDSYFYYLTGFTEPNAWLVLDASGRSTLFVSPKMWNAKFGTAIAWAQRRRWMCWVCMPPIR